MNSEQVVTWCDPDGWWGAAVQMGPRWVMGRGRTEEEALRNASAEAFADKDHSRWYGSDEHKGES